MDLLHVIGTNDWKIKFTFLFYSFHISGKQDRECAKFSVNSSTKRENKMPIRDWTIVRILAGIATKIWAASFAALLACFILYCFYGGLMALSLLIAAIAGTKIIRRNIQTISPHLFIRLFSQEFSIKCKIIYCTIRNSHHTREFSFRYHQCSVSASFQSVSLRLFINAFSGLPYESINIRSTDGVTLHAFWIRHNGDKGRFVPTIVYFHGNAGNIGHRLQNAAGMFHTLQCNLLMVDYRGYGLSTGTPIERGLYNDARAAIDYLYTRHDLDLSQIVLFGRSLGGAVAIDVASDPEYYQKLMCVVLENTFTSIPDMAVSLIHQSIGYFPHCIFKNLVS